MIDMYKATCEHLPFDTLTMTLESRSSSQVIQPDIFQPFSRVSYKK